MRRRSLESPATHGRIAIEPGAADRRVFAGRRAAPDIFRSAFQQPDDYSTLYPRDPVGIGTTTPPHRRAARLDVASSVPGRAATVALTVAVLLIAAGGPARAVAHGSAVPDGKYAFAVKLTDIGIPTASGGRRDSSCSGALISPHWVLTAGHCFRDAHDVRVSRPVAKKSVATVGRADLTGTDGHDANVVAVRQHGTADISLARLDRAITDIKPLRIGRTRPRVGDPVRLTGFGLTTATASQLPTRLRTGKFRVSSVDGLEIGMTGTSPHDDTSPCPHDSGGPYFTEAANGTATVVGVVSHGPACPHRGPDMAARVDAVASWILSVVGTDLSTSPPPSIRPSPAPSLTAVAAPPPPRRAAHRYGLIAGGGALLCAVAAALWWRGLDRHRGTRRARG